MCGIAGSLGIADEKMVATMTEAQSHRGPDDKGVFIDKNAMLGGIGLGHRRLSILDVSAAGHQPMSYENGRLWITYNGEVYNFREIRKELEARGKKFVSNTDTEVILAAYAQWGRSCVERFRGMFAFVIYDKSPPDENWPVLFMVRDRLGIKPLLYWRKNGVLLFASEIRGLLASGLLVRKADPVAVADYLATGSVLQPRSMIEGVQWLEAGHWLSVAVDGTQRIERYWDILEATASMRRESLRLDYAEQVGETRRLLEEATRFHLVADVPVGAFLSGGIDSTAIVGLMASQSTLPIKTFSVGFESKHARYSELSYAKIAANRLKTDHTEVVVTDAEVPQLFDAAIAAIDQPCADGFNTYIVARAAAATAKVALSGLGGDELFAGYSHFPRISRAREILPEGIPNLHPAIKKILLEKVAMVSLLPAMTLLPRLERIAVLRRYLQDYDFPACVTAEIAGCYEPVKRTTARFIRRELTSFQETTFTDINVYLRNVLLRDSDVMGMAHSLEIRPVLLDHCLAEFAFSMPDEFKYRDHQYKRLLTDAVRDILPQETIQRKKMGFVLPLSNWTAGILKSRVLDAIQTRQAQTVFKKKYLASLGKNIAEGAPVHQAWAWAVLFSWMNVNQIEL